MASSKTFFEKQKKKNIRAKLSFQIFGQKDQLNCYEKKHPHKVTGLLLVLLFILS